MGLTVAPSGARALRRACERAGWRLVSVVEGEDAIGAALERIADGTARGVVVDDARVLSRSLDFAALVRELVDADAPLVALDLGVDTSTPEGTRVARLLITLDAWRRPRPAWGGTAP